MWKCPVCDQENNAATVCPTCGYDRTCDYERYPTAFTVKRATPTHTLRRQWQEKQNPPTKPQPRPAEAKPRPTAPPVAAPASVPTPAAAPAKKKSGLWKVLLAVAVIAIVIAVVNQEKSSNKTPANSGNPSAEYTVDYVEDRVHISLDSGTISGQMVDDAQNLLKEHACTKLWISGGTINAASMEQISKLTDVEEIDFYYWTKLSGFDRLSGMPHLSLIDLSAFSASEPDLTGIERIGTLKYLTISDSKSIDLGQLKNATQLTDLLVVRCNITSLNGLEGLTGLKSLVLDNNQISDLKPLSNLTSLTLLQVNDNQISDLRPLSTLTNLYSLQISNNQITTLAGLENLTNLTHIYASGNPLTDTSALEVSGCMNALYTG